MLTAAQPLRLAALRLPPFLAHLAAERAKTTPKGWPSWLPAPANRPDEAALRQAETPAEESGDDAEAGAALPASPTVSGGWVDSSLDLKLGLDVIDLGPVEWFDALECSFG